MDYHQPRDRMERTVLCPLRLNNNTLTTNSGNNVHASDCKPHYWTTRHSPHDQPRTTGPHDYYQCQAAIIAAATPVPFTGHTHGDVIRKAAVFMELIEHYRIPELTITLLPEHTITIERTPCHTNHNYCPTSSPHYNTNSQHHDAQSTPASSETANGQNSEYTTSANTVENTP